MTEFQKLWIEYIPLDDLVKMERNPKLHSPEIAASFERYGFVEPVLIDEGSGKLVAGHGRLEKLIEARDGGQDPPHRIEVRDDVWLVPVIRGVTFESEDQAEEYGVTSNALTIEGGFDEAELEKLIEESGMDPIGLEAEIEREAGIAEAMVSVEAAGDLEDDISRAVSNVSGDEPHSDSDQKPVVHEKHEKKLSDQQVYDQLPFEEGGPLNKVKQLAEEAYFPPDEDEFRDQCIDIRVGGVDLEIPNLRPDMLVDELPGNLQTWGDRLGTPDKGDTWWFYNYGAAPHRDLPFERTIFSFFTHDKHIETWWATPAYRVGQILIAGVKSVVVPDFSLWDTAPTVLHLRALYRAAWMGRYFQEAGLKVIPRIEGFQDKSKKVALNGIPKGAPIVATQFQTEFADEDKERIYHNLVAALKIVEPKTLLIYASKRGREFVDEIKAGLPCELLVLKTSSEVRKKEVRKKETNPALLELRKQKRGRNPDRETTPNK